jgi:hypothetical protein
MVQSAERRRDAPHHIDQSLLLLSNLAYPPEFCWIIPLKPLLVKSMARRSAKSPICVGTRSLTSFLGALRKWSDSSPINSHGNVPMRLYVEDRFE